MPWSVFLAQEKLPLPVGQIGRWLKEAIGGSAQDHAQRVNLQHGWVARGLEEGAADRAVSVLESNGLAALKKDEARLLKLERSLVVRKAKLLPDGLHLPLGAGGALAAQPWPEVSLVSIGSVVSRHREQVAGTRTKMGLNVGLFAATGVPLPKRVTVKSTVSKEVIEESVVIQLILARLPLAVEIHPKEFDYSYLESRLSRTSRENLMVLLEDLERLAGGSHWTGISRTFLATGKLEPDFKDERDFLRFNQWIAEAALA
jgi:hypothetical protein